MALRPTTSCRLTRACTYSTSIRASTTAASSQGQLATTRAYSIPRCIGCRRIRLLNRQSLALETQPQSSSTSSPGRVWTTILSEQITILILRLAVLAVAGSGMYSAAKRSILCSMQLLEAQSAPLRGRLLQRLADLGAMGSKCRMH